MAYAWGTRFSPGHKKKPTESIHPFPYTWEKISVGSFYGLPPSSPSMVQATQQTHISCGIKTRTGLGTSSQESHVLFLTSHIQ